jgi:hypothetical protein
LVFDSSEESGVKQIFVQLEGRISNGKKISKDSVARSPQGSRIETPAGWLDTKGAGAPQTADLLS